MSFSSSDQDSALAFMHDLGFIPKIKNGERGFKVMLVKNSRKIEGFLTELDLTLRIPMSCVKCVPSSKLLDFYKMDFRVSFLFCKMDFGFPLL